MHNLDLGTAEIYPQEPVIAGTFTTISYEYTAGHPIDDSGYIKIVFRIVSDCGTPQFDHPDAPNFCSVTTSGNCHIEPRWDPKGHKRPWSRALYLQIKRGYLDRGESVRVVFGDTAQGSNGWLMQTFCARSFEFKTFVDPIATYEFKELLNSPAVSVIPGCPARAVCIAPPQVTCHTPLTYYVKLEDKWGNPIDKPEPRNHPGWNTPGIKYISALDEETGFSAVSHPVMVVDKPTALNPYWADFHGQSEETVGTNPIEDYFTFARDYGLVDIVGHQGNDFQVTDAFWDKINQVSSYYNQPGTFVTFPGYEWSGNTPLGGDRNVYFTAEKGRITRSGRDLLPGYQSAYPDSPTVPDLFSNLKSQVNPTAFVFAHVGGRYADLNFHDAAIELAVEVHSAWGTFEWLVEEALQKGYRIGIVANSDGHKGRPGASYPGAGDFGSYGGLTCVLAQALDRDSLYQALKSRHFYATTGNRCLIHVSIQTDNATAMMGDVIETGNSTAHLHASIAGTGPIENIEVRNNSHVLKVIRPYSEKDLGHRIKITWSGAEVKGRNRMARWDGYLDVRENTILDMTPINFWNCSQPMKQINKNHIEWQSITTGGASGMLLRLQKECEGCLELHTYQMDISCQIKDLGIQPNVFKCGGLKKEIHIARLPERPCPNNLSFDLDLHMLQPGDNPIYIRVSQENGHLAWTSPIYVVNKKAV